MDVVRIPFIENLGGVPMCSSHTGTDTRCQVESQWQPQGLPFAQHTQTVEKCSASNQARTGLMTVAKQPGWEKRRAPIHHDIVKTKIKSTTKCYLH